MHLNLNTPLDRLRTIAWTEGTSYLILLFIAMPLKYGLDWPYAVRYVGWLHGLLFILYGLSILETWTKERWSFARATLVFIAGLIPFGTYWLEKNLLKKLASQKIPAGEQP